jgi:hypothetical protein
MRLLPAFLLAAGISAAQEFPQAEISNGILKAKLYLPDAEKGYYRATRFDWAGVIPSLTFKGHEYFGLWFDRYDPKLHDAIMGPVESFKTATSAIGYDEAKAGETFLRIGVGVLRKPEEKAFSDFRTYDIVNGGRWATRADKDRVEFTHVLVDETGYAYTYRKVVRLLRGKPVMVIEHSLKNEGKKALETSVFNHNFFVLDNLPTGPDWTVTFPFELRPTRDVAPLAAIKGKQLTYLRELEPKQSVFTQIEGFGKTAADYDIRMENRKADAGVRITGDKPLSKIVYWSVRRTLCPEPYIDISAAPGREFRWSVRYEFYTLEK